MGMKTFRPTYLSIFIIIFCSLFSAGKISAASSSKTIFLTFDADMNHRMQKEQSSGSVKKWYDPALVEYLKKNNIPATFFVTGMFAEMYPDLIKEIAADQNFSIQNHSYDHPAFEPHCFGLPVITSDRKKLEEIGKTQGIIKKITGSTPAYFRFPGLCHKPHDDASVSAEGLKIVKGEVVSGDAFLKKPAAIVANTLHAIARGQVVIFHLGTKLTPGTTAAVELLVPKLEGLGYTFGRL